MSEEATPEVNLKKDGNTEREAVQTRLHGFRILFNGDLL
jgi:hypothetical protein